MNILEQDRTKRGMTIKKYADFLNISLNTYKKLIKGYKIPDTIYDVNRLDVDVFLRIHHATGIYFNEIFPDHPLNNIIKNV